MNVQQRYSLVHAIFVDWNSDPQAEIKESQDSNQQAEIVQNRQGLNQELLPFVDDILRVSYNDDLEGDSRIKGEGMMDCIRQSIEAKDAPNVLFVVVYVGHADLRLRRLFGTRDDLFSVPLKKTHEHPNLDFTWLGSYARNRCKADFLFILDCPFGGFLPIELASPPSNQRCHANSHKVEILSASHVDFEFGSEHDYSRRLAADLHQFLSPPSGTTAVSRSRRISNAYSHAPGVHKKCGNWNGDIDLRARRELQKGADQ